MITRAQMPRQLRDEGGIVSVTPREKYGLGSKIKERFRKLIPNELASIAVAAAPFVAPFNPGIAAIMRGVGRFDQRGSISDAVKQGLGTFAFGKGVRALGGAPAQEGFFGTPGDRFTSPLSADRTTAVKDFFKSDPTRFETKAGGKEAKKGIELVSKTADKAFENIPIVRDLPDTVKQKLLVGGITGGVTGVVEYFQNKFRPPEPGETMEEYLAARRERVGQKMRSLFDNYFKSDPEYSALDDAGRDAFIARYNLKDGGRADYQTGGITMANTLAENIRRNLANQAAVAQQFRQARRNIPGFIEPVVKPAPKAAPIKIEEPDLPISRPVQPLLPVMPDQPGLFPQPSKPDNFIERVIPQDPPKKIIPVDPPKKIIPEDPPPLIDDLVRLPVEPRTDQDIIEGFAKFKEQNPEVMQGVGTAAIIEGILPDGTPITFSGGLESSAFNKYLESLGLSRADILRPKTMPIESIGLEKLAGGGMPTGIMKTNKAGVMERDYRDKGGFVPVGIKEKADDVPAMLSKNEFVFTADAVRGAGNGSVEKGAQKMYDTMKNLEKRVT